MAFCSGLICVYLCLSVAVFSVVRSRKESTHFTQPYAPEEMPVPPGKSVFFSLPYIFQREWHEWANGANKTLKNTRGFPEKKPLTTKQL
jgi:hypothetical protein